MTLRGAHSMYVHANIPKCRRAGTYSTGARTPHGMTTWMNSTRSLSSFAFSRNIPLRSPLKMLRRRECRTKKGHADPLGVNCATSICSLTLLICDYVMYTECRPLWLCRGSRRSTMCSGTRSKGNQMRENKSFDRRWCGACKSERRT